MAKAAGSLEDYYYRDITLFYKFIEMFRLNRTSFVLSHSSTVGVEMMDWLLILTYCITLCLGAICDRWEHATFVRSRILWGSI